MTARKQGPATPQHGRGGTGGTHVRSIGHRRGASGHAPAHLPAPWTGAAGFASRGRLAQGRGAWPGSPCTEWGRARRAGGSRTWPVHSSCACPWGDRRSADGFEPSAADKKKRRVRGKSRAAPRANTGKAQGMRALVRRGTTVVVDPERSRYLRSLEEMPRSADRGAGVEAKAVPESFQSLIDLYNQSVTRGLRSHLRTASR